MEEGRDRAQDRRRMSKPTSGAGKARRARAFRRLAIAAALFAATVAGAAGMTKTLRVAFRTAENGFDPQAAYDAYSFYVIGGIFDPLYVYDYFARPVRMIPNTAA